MYWKQRGWFKPVYELFDGSSCIGSLVVRPGWKDEADATMRSGTVRFRQQSWWRRSYEAVDVVTRGAVATYAGSAWKNEGVFDVAGETFVLKRAFWRQSTEVSDASDTTLFKMKTADWLGKRQEVTLGDGISLDGRTELLLYFATFLTVSAIRAEASSTAVTVPT